MRAVAVATAAVVLAVLAASGCSGSSSSSSPPADFTGVYSVSVTDETNGCNYGGWTVGKTAQNVELDVTQSGGNVTGQVKGLANVYFALLGIGPLNGTANGASAEMSATGTNSVKSGSCAYFVRATIDVTLTGDTVNGTVTYSNQTNGDPSCGALATCTSTQDIAGSRPPK